MEDGSGTWGGNGSIAAYMYHNDRILERHGVQESHQGQVRDETVHSIFPKLGTPKRSPLLHGMEGPPLSASESHARASFQRRDCGTLFRQRATAVGTPWTGTAHAVYPESHVGRSKRPVIRPWVKRVPRAQRVRNTTKNHGNGTSSGVTDEGSAAALPVGGVQIRHRLCGSLRGRRHLSWVAGKPATLWSPEPSLGCPTCERALLWELAMKPQHVAGRGL